MTNTKDLKWQYELFARISESAPTERVRKRLKEVSCKLKDREVKFETAYLQQ